MSFAPPRLSARAAVRIAAACGVAALWWWAVSHVTLEAALAAYRDFRGLVADNRALALAAYGAAYALVAALALPAASLLTLMGGALFGGLAGSLATALAATLGACLLFLAARRVLHGYFLRKFGSMLTRIRGGFAADAASYLLLMRLAPVFPFAVVTVAAALLGARFSTFAWTTGLGILPGTAAYTLVGAGAGEALTREADRLHACRQAGAACAASLDLSSLVSRDIALGLAALAMIMIMSMAARRYLNRRGAPPPAEGA